MTSGCRGCGWCPLDVTDGATWPSWSAGATSIVNALNPAQYWRWDELWPPMAAAVLAAAESSGAHLVTVGNLYVYGKVDGPMTEATPLDPNGHKGALRAQMWQDALALHRRGADPGHRGSRVGLHRARHGRAELANSQVVRPAIAGTPVLAVGGRPDAPHTWTNGADVARLAARLCTEPADSDAWGRPWHVPSAAPRTHRASCRPTPRRWWAARHGDPAAYPTASWTRSDSAIRCCASSGRRGTSSSAVRAGQQRCAAAVRAGADALGPHRQGDGGPPRGAHRRVGQRDCCLIRLVSSVTWL